MPKWWTDRLTDTGTAGAPASCQALFCRQAVRSTHSSIGTICRHSSAKGTNCAGMTSPRIGWFQRTSASRPTTLLDSPPTWGW